MGQTIESISIPQREILKRVGSALDLTFQAMIFTLIVLDAYTRALSTWATWVDNNVNTQTTQVIFVGDTTTHYSGGQWNSGGQCRNETEPIFNTSQLTNYPPKMRAFGNVLRVMKTPVVELVGSEYLR
ncbi:trichome birefringence-like protein 2 [Tanacetum coccineum]